MSIEPDLSEADELAKYLKVFYRLSDIEIEKLCNEVIEMVKEV